MAPTPVPLDAPDDSRAAAARDPHLAATAGDNEQTDSSTMGEEQSPTQSDASETTSEFGTALAEHDTAGTAAASASPAEPLHDQGAAPAHATGGKPSHDALEVAARLVADANAAAEALENLKRLLERGPSSSMGGAPAGSAPTAVSLAPLVPAPTTADTTPPATTGGTVPARRTAAFASPAPPPRERSRLDVHGFLAGFALSLAVGALLYLLLTAG